MTNIDALKIAEQVAAGRCSVTLHRGAGHEVAVRLSGCDLRDAAEVGRDIAAALPGGAYRQSGGFAAVWFDRRRDAEADRLMVEAAIEDAKSQS